MPVNSRSLIGAIYRKELLDVLRDRRTLTAMIVIPVVLYPVVMLLVMRAAETEQVSLANEQYVVEVPDQETRQAFTAILEQVSAQRKADEHHDEHMPTFELAVGHTPPSRLGRAACMRSSSCRPRRSRPRCLPSSRRRSPTTKWTSAARRR